MILSRRKEFTYKGKTIEELKKLSIREFAKELSSRERRHILRNFQEIERFVSSVKEKREKNKKIRTHKRDLIIVPELVGTNIQVHNGKEFVPVEIVSEMLGHKLGEFSLTRKKVTHSKSGIGATKGTKHKAKK